MLKQRLTGILQRSALVFLVALLPALAAALPVPPNVAIIPPGADLAPEIAAFSGTWEGLWDEKEEAPVRLIVERIDATSARIVIIWDTGYSRRKANVLPGGKIEFGPSGGPYFVFTMSKDRTSIGGEREHKGEILTTTMKKVGQQ